MLIKTLYSFLGFLTPLWKKPVGLSKLPNTEIQEFVVSKIFIIEVLTARRMNWRKLLKKNCIRQVKQERNYGSRGKRVYRAWCAVGRSQATCVCWLALSGCKGYLLADTEFGVNCPLKLGSSPSRKTGT